MVMLINIQWNGICPHILALVNSEQMLKHIIIATEYLLATAPPFDNLVALQQFTKQSETVQHLQELALVYHQQEDPVKQPPHFFHHRLVSFQVTSLIRQTLLFRS